MLFIDYQLESAETAEYLKNDQKYGYLALGLVGEAGEVCNIIKRIYRNGANPFSDEIRGRVQEEIGDTLWYLSQLCSELGLSLDYTAGQNLKKLAERKARGEIKTRKKETQLATEEQMLKEVWDVPPYGNNPPA